ncbi:MAG: response regulator [Betaproteobacteria bacterium]
MRRPRSGPPLPPGPFFGFVVAIFVIVLIAVISYQALQARVSTAEMVSHTIQVMEHLQGVLSTVKDAETGQRGYLLTGSEQYLEPYTAAKTSLPTNIRQLRALISDSQTQTQRVDTLEKIAEEKMAELAQTIELRRNGDLAGAMSVVRSDRGKAAMDSFRGVMAQLETEERTLLAQRQRDWQDAVNVSSVITWTGSGLLLILIIAAAVMSSRDYRARETETWLRSGQAGLSERLQGGQRLEELGSKALDFLVTFLDARVATIYMTDASGRLRRFADYAAVKSGHGQGEVAGGLLEQAAKSRKMMVIRDLPEGYLTVSSSVGRATPRGVILAPAIVDGGLQAVIELGFFRQIYPEDEQLLGRVSELLAVVVRAAKDRSRLEELLEETQRQSEELQAQQEELRVNNEELEEQGRVLKVSQAQMEAQQAELEQTNSQLEEQTQMLEKQRESLAQSQEILTEKADLLERSNEYKSEFLANMSHELRTPLNSTLILAKLLADNREGNLSGEQVKFAQTISSAGNDLLALIDDILDLSKIEAGKVDITPEPVSIKGAIESVAKFMQPIAAQKGLAFTSRIADNTPPRIETDPQRVAQILKNLLSNALKFTEKGSVSIEVSEPVAGSISFAICDSGIGIPPSQQEIIFEAFRQADGSTHRKYGGTGLGLSISRDLARLLGGDISVRSTAGTGSTFTLTLPVTYAGPAAGSVPAATGSIAAESRTPVATASPSPAAPARDTPKALPVRTSPMGTGDDRNELSAGKRTILVVEDDPNFAAILRDLVHEMGFQCVIAHSAREAMTAAGEYQPSGVLLDMNLPDHSGLSVLDQLKRDPSLRHAPVHVISGVDYSHEALERGAVGYAFKPVKREQLIDALRLLEAKISQTLHRVLVVEDDVRQLESLRQLLGAESVQITGVSTAAEALQHLGSATFDCIVMDLNLPDMSGYDLLDKMGAQDNVSFPPVIVYTGRSLSHEEEQMLRRYSRSIIIKDARSPERLLDEVTLFLHQVESRLPAESQRMLRVARDREETFEKRNILVVEDDVRNVFALSRVLEQKGAKIQIARNGKEALDALEKSQSKQAEPIDLVLMDIMMPEMDGFTAMRFIRQKPEWKKLPIIALTAKAMKDDQEKCLAAGANDYIAKPLDVEQLLSLIRVWLPK